MTLMGDVKTEENTLAAGRNALLTYLQMPDDFFEEVDAMILEDGLVRFSWTFSLRNERGRPYRQTITGCWEKDEVVDWRCFNQGRGAGIGSMPFKKASQLAAWLGLTSPRE